MKEPFEDPKDLSFKLLEEMYKTTPDINIIKNLLDKGADPNVMNENGETCLFFLARDKESSVYRENIDYEIAELLFKKNADPNKFDKYGNSPLGDSLYRTEMFENEDGKFFKWLIEHKADPSLVCPQTNVGCLNSIGPRTELETVKYLLDKKADPTLISKYENGRVRGNILNQVCNWYEPCIDIIQLLLKNKVDPDVTNNQDGNELNCLQQLCYNHPSKLKVIKLLLLHSKHPEFINPYTDDLLDHITRAPKHYDLALLLLINRPTDQMKLLRKQLNDNPLGKLINLLRHHDNPQEIIKFIEKCIDESVPSSSLGKYYQKLPEQDKNVVYTSLLLFKKFHKENRFKMPRPIQFMIINEVEKTNKSLGCEAETIINNTLDHFKDLEKKSGPTTKN